MPRPEPATGAARPHLLWADVAKGGSIALVVLHHLVSKHYVDVLPSALDGVGGAWLDLTYGLKPVRLPVFFLISGFFAAGALRRSWSEVWPTRLANLYYLYAVWLVIHAVLLLQLRQLPLNRTRNGTELVLDLVYASTGLWYLYALVVYFGAARLLRPVDPRLVVLAAGALALAAPFLGIAAANRASVLQHFVYFVLGAYFPAAVERMARLDPAHAVGLTVLAVAATLVAGQLGLRDGTTRVLVSTALVPVAVRVAVALSRWPVVTRPLAHVGRRTLPIYVLHVPVLALAHLVVASRLPLGDPGPGPLAWALYPLLGAAVVLTACLAAHRALERLGGGRLFRGPFARPQPTAPRRAVQPRHTAPVPGPAPASGTDCPHADRAAHRG